MTPQPLKVHITGVGRQKDVMKYPKHNEIHMINLLNYQACIRFIFKHL